jgi:O-antigen/teichoic acid export membrane protein
MNDPLFKNAFYIVISRFFNAAVIGFLFWTIAARLYSPESVGIGAALISALGLITTFSLLGFDISMLRFQDKFDKNAIYNTCIWVVTIASLIISIIFLLLIDIISPNIVIIRGYWYLFVFFAVLESLIFITGRAYLAFRKGFLFFIQTISLSLRIPILFLFVSLDFLGIFLAMGIACIFTIIITIFMMSKIVTLKFEISKPFINTTARYSLLNYFSNITFAIPILIMPILILALLGGEAAAYYYIAFVFANLLLIIPDAFSLSFLIEGGKKVGQLRKETMKTLKTNILILVPFVVGIFLFGQKILEIFGPSYVEGFPLLCWLAISSFFVSVFHMFLSAKNIQILPEKVLIMNIIRLGLIIGLSYPLLIQFGIIGFGYAWVITYVILDVIIFITVQKPKWLLIFSGIKE